MRDVIGVFGLVFTVVGAVMLLWSAPDIALTPSANQAPAASVCDPSGGMDPRSSGEVDALISGYFHCPYEMLAALDDVYTNEKRDEAWAAKVEDKIKLIARSTGARVKGECHSSLCRVDFKTASGTCELLGRDFDRPLMNALKGTEFQVSVAYAGPTGCRRYIYSTVIPPAFLEPLREKMAAAK